MSPSFKVFVNFKKKLPTLLSIWLVIYTVLMSMSMLLIISRCIHTTKELIHSHLLYSTMPERYINYII